LKGCELKVYNHFEKKKIDFVREIRGKRDWLSMGISGIEIDFC